MKNKQATTIIILFYLLIIANGSLAQVKNSIYSMYGIGQVIENNYGINRAMGGTGIAFQSGNSINTINPASYLGVSPNSFTIEMGIYGIYNHASDGNITQTTGDINISYFLADLYINNWWAISFGILPVSSVDYQINSSDQVNGELTTYEKTYSGNGGISQGYIGQSFKLTKRLTVGFNAAYYLGNLTQTEIGGGENSYTEYELENKKTINGLHFNYGLQYSIEKADELYTLGLIYGSNKTLNTINDLSFTNTDTTISLEQNNQINIRIPRNFGLGISMKKGSNFRIGLDYQWKNWAQSNFNPSIFETKNSNRLSVGMEYSPNTRESKPFGQISYRLGANYQNSYLAVNNVRINSFGVNWGIGFPMKRNNSLNFTIEYGEEGTLKKGLIKYSYWAFYLHFSLHEFWSNQKR
ncbi:MAG TPA: hypothetical protein PLV30_07535 [Candidatus Marinimicrobia bacterium]|nr:hypothetical protein [Candidatus Neomarinimicrobiota bacterium]HQE96048.1 hypothetical protein [Candidatus Neomarinimicrobiota bacterium]HQH56892.1 hypothetical protein [Candidatus Neomarinimicrobiota bacterium]HQK11857.1 hypothetical protein [Candidatus Neomarinimicrobiota bacterium]